MDELECQVIMNDVQFYAHTSALVYEGAKTRIIAHGGFGESSGHCRQNYLRVYDLTNSGIELPIDIIFPLEIEYLWNYHFNVK